MTDMEFEVKCSIPEPLGFELFELATFPRVWLTSSYNGTSVHVISKAPLLVEVMIELPSAWNSKQMDDKQAAAFLAGVYLAKSCFPEVESNGWDVMQISELYDRRTKLRLYPSSPANVTVCYATPHNEEWLGIIAENEKKRSGKKK